MASRADGCFIDSEVVEQANSPFEELPMPETILDLDGRTLVKGTCQTIPDCFGEPPWTDSAVGTSLFFLQTRSGITLSTGTCPQFNWAKGSLTGCSVSCISNCLHSALSSQPASMDPLSEVPDLSAVLRHIMTCGWGCSVSSEPSPYLLIVPVSLESTCFQPPMQPFQNRTGGHGAVQSKFPGCWMNLSFLPHGGRKEDGWVT